MEVMTVVFKLKLLISKKRKKNGIGIGGLQDSVNRMELGLVDKFQRVEDTLNKPSTALFHVRKGPVAIRVISLATMQR